MPASPSRHRAADSAAPGSRRTPAGAKPEAPALSLWPLLVLVGLLAALAVAVSALPASIVTRFAPAWIRAQDFSGSLWHGSAGQITANGRDAGALEWHLHPLALAHLRLDADLHWVKGGFVLDGAADVDRHRILLSNLEGGGPIEDLRDFGLAAGWRGSASVRVRKLAAISSEGGVRLTSATGEIRVANLTSSQIARGADLGSYSLTFDEPSIGAESDASARLTDTGGPLALDALVHLSAAARRGTLSGTVGVRDEAPLSLKDLVDDLGRLHARDAQGRFPLDFEFTF
ncbi:MAG TPA: type II secretion system protein N [Steroidobacteraceae bacterium]|nr:type II secretion system protein N [Steroidobacteraceae bacterium]